MSSDLPSHLKYLPSALRQQIFFGIMSFSVLFLSSIILFGLFTTSNCSAKLSRSVVGTILLNSIDRIDQHSRWLHGNHKIFVLRGGKKDKGKKNAKEHVEVAEANEEDSQTSDNNDEDDVMGGLEDDNNRSNQLLSSVSSMWTKTPPVTQVYIGSSLFLSLATFILNKNIWPEYLNLDWRKVFMRFEIWRPFTAFMFFGPLGMNYLLTIHFVWTYMSQLEKLNFKAPEDFLVLIIFGAVTLIPLYSFLGLSTKFLGHNLSTYLVYIWARLFEGTDVNVMDLFLLRAEVLPWFFCAQTFILEGEIPFADLLGIVVGHLYHYLKKRNLLTAPTAVKNLFSSESMRQKYAQFSEDFELM